MSRARASSLLSGLAFLLLAAGVATAQTTAAGRCPMMSATAEPLPGLAGDVFDAANAARAEIEVGRTAGVAAQLDSALAAADVLDPTSRAQLEIHVGRSFERIGSRRRAAELFSAAAKRAATAEAWRLQTYALGYLAALYEADGRNDEALELTRRALFAAHRAEAPDALYRWQWQLGRIQRAAGDVDAAIAAYRAGVATLAGVREIGGPDLLPFYLEFVDMLLLRADAATGAARQALLAEARNALEDQKAAELRDYFQDACLDAQRKAAPDMVPGTLVVYPILLSDRVVLIVSQGGELTSHVVPVDRETLDAEVLAFRKALGRRTTRHYMLHARKLYEWLIVPIEPALARGDVETLVFVPGGSLRTIPFAALQDPKTKEFLIEKVPVAITPGLTLTDPSPIDRGRVELLAAGISDSVQGYPALENVIHEIESVRELFPGRYLLNQEFVAQRFEAEVSEQPFGIVHLASHGEFAADSSESYMLTYTGRLSMDQLAALVSTTRFRERGLELLTLSACETATGDDRAALGLAGVALRAGARSALATLWPVNDQASAELVVEFYKQLSDSENSRAKALQRAQVKVLNFRAYKHPGYWAPYLLIGSWL